MKVLNFQDCVGNTSSTQSASKLAFYSSKLLFTSFFESFRCIAQDLRWISILLFTWTSSTVCLWIFVLLFLFFFFFFFQQLLSYLGSFSVMPLYSHAIAYSGSFSLGINLLITNLAYKVWELRFGSWQPHFSLIFPIPWLVELAYSSSSFSGWIPVRLVLLELMYTRFSMLKKPNDCLGRLFSDLNFI